MPSVLQDPIYTDVRSYTGDPDIFWDIRRQRISSLEVMQRMGTPVLLKRMYNAEDVELGVAQVAPTMDKNYYQPTYETDQVSWGVGYCSLDTQDGEWYDPNTGIVYASNVNPNPGVYLPAPRYRGYGPGFLTYAILPDLPEDVWKLTQQGTLIRQQQARAQLPWWPQVGDNDLLITCRLEGNVIVETYERYKLKQVAPITMRGRDRAGNREFEANASGNRFWVGQQCEMAKVPTNDPIYSVETDR